MARTNKIDDLGRRISNHLNHRHEPSNGGKREDVKCLDEKFLVVLVLLACHQNSSTTTATTATGTIQSNLLHNTLSNHFELIAFACRLLFSGASSSPSNPSLWYAALGARILSLFYAASSPSANSNTAHNATIRKYLRGALQIRGGRVLEFIDVDIAAALLLSSSSKGCIEKEEEDKFWSNMEILLRRCYDTSQIEHDSRPIEKSSSSSSFVVELIQTVLNYETATSTTTKTRDGTKEEPLNSNVPHFYYQTLLLSHLQSRLSASWHIKPGSSTQQNKQRRNILHLLISLSTSHKRPSVVVEFLPVTLQYLVHCLAVSPFSDATSSFPQWVIIEDQNEEKYDIMNDIFKLLLAGFAYNPTTKQEQQQQQQPFLLESIRSWTVTALSHWVHSYGWNFAANLSTSSLFDFKKEERHSLGMATVPCLLLRMAATELQWCLHLIGQSKSSPQASDLDHNDHKKTLGKEKDHIPFILSTIQCCHRLALDTMQIMLRFDDDEEQNGATSVTGHSKGDNFISTWNAHAILHVRQSFEWILLASVQFLTLSQHSVADDNTIIKTLFGPSNNDMCQVALSCCQYLGAYLSQCHDLSFSSIMTSSSFSNEESLRLCNEEGASLHALRCALQICHAIAEQRHHQQQTMNSTAHHEDGTSKVMLTGTDEVVSLLPCLTFILSTSNGNVKESIDDQENKSPKTYDDNVSSSFSWKLISRTLLREDGSSIHFPEIMSCLIRRLYIFTTTSGQIHKDDPIMLHTLATSLSWCKIVLDAWLSFISDDHLILFGMTNIAVDEVFLHRCHQHRTEMAQTLESLILKMQQGQEQNTGNRLFDIFQKECMDIHDMFLPFH